MFSVNNIFNGGCVNSIQLNGKANSTHATNSQMNYGIFEQDKGVNSLIDEGVFQGDKGDCWLLSGVLSMSYTKDGEQLIKNAISQNCDGSYNVFFKGIKKCYTITQNELNSKNVKVLDDATGKKSSPYSTGDDDMLLMELALEKVVEDKSVPIQTVEGISGGSAYYLYQLLTDNHVAYAYGNENPDAVLSMLNYYDTFEDTCSATVGVIDSFNGLEDDHAYAVKSIDKGVVTLVNPWDSTETVDVSVQDMIKNSKNYDVSLVDYELPEQRSYFQEFYM